MVNPYCKQQRNKRPRNEARQRNEPRPCNEARQRNEVKQTPWQLFKSEHETMHEKGEKWMKDAADSCMLVATLIATVVFAAAFTVPGGNNQDTGTPIFLQNNTFMLFAIFDALALFSFINSLWMFLSIRTARFAQEDFLETLPKRLIFGLATLFLAIVSSVVAFSAALSLVPGHRQSEVIILIVLMAFASVAMFAILQLPLLIEMVRSTYCLKLLGS